MKSIQTTNDIAPVCQIGSCLSTDQICYREDPKRQGLFQQGILNIHLLYTLQYVNHVPRSKEHVNLKSSQTCFLSNAAITFVGKDTREKIRSTCFNEEMDIVRHSVRGAEKDLQLIGYIVMAAG